MLNLVAVQVMNYLPRTDGQQVAVVLGDWPHTQTKLLSENSWLPTLVSGTQLNLGVVIAVAVAVAVYILLWRTGFGFRTRAVGCRPTQPLRRMPSSAHDERHGLSGRMLRDRRCLSFRSISHRMGRRELTGFTARWLQRHRVALFGGLKPLWSILSATF